MNGGSEPYLSYSDKLSIEFLLQKFRPSTLSSSDTYHFPYNVACMRRGKILLLLDKILVVLLAAARWQLL